MRAFRPAGGSLAPCDVADPEPPDDGVVVDIHAAALGAPELAARAPELTPGGAAVGEVVAAGEAATHLLGNRVLLGPLEPCGECDRCRRGAVWACAQLAIRGHSFDGALAQRAVARARWVCPLVEGLELPNASAAAIGRELAEPYALYARAGVGPGEPVVIAGDGARARLLVQLARARGTRPIVVTADDGYAARLGEDGCRAVAPGDDLLARTRAAAADAGFGERPWRVFEPDGDADARARAVALAVDGAIVALGRAAAPTATRVDVDDLVAGGCTLLGVPGAHPDLLSEVAALVVRGDLSLDDLVDVVPAGDIGVAVTRAADRTRIVVVDFRA